MGSAEEKICSPRAFTHMSTGVVYASPGVVKIPPCVLDRVRMAHVAQQVHHEDKEDTDADASMRKTLGTLVVLNDRCNVQQQPRRPSCEVFVRLNNLMIE